MRLARIQHAVLLGIAAGRVENPNAIVGFNAGVQNILDANRDATDVELLALENLSDQLFAAAEEDEQPASGDEMSVPSLAPSSSEDEPPAEETSTLPQEQVSGAAEAEPEAAGDAEASQASVTPGAGEPAPAGAADAEALFAPQEHDGDEHLEDDGA